MHDTFIAVFNIKFDNVAWSVGLSQRRVHYYLISGRLVIYDTLAIRKLLLKSLHQLTQIFNAMIIASDLITL